MSDLRYYVVLPSIIQRYCYDPVMSHLLRIKSIFNCQYVIEFSSTSERQCRLCIPIVWARVKHGKSYKLYFKKNTKTIVNKIIILYCISFMHAGPARCDDSGRAELLLRRVRPGRRARVRGGHSVRPGASAGLRVLRVWQVGT